MLGGESWPVGGGGRVPPANQSKTNRWARTYVLYRQIGDKHVTDVDLYAGWTAWLLGYPCNKAEDSNGEMYDAPVRPLHLLRNGYLPAKVKKKFDNYWRPVLELMHEEVAATIASKSAAQIDDQFIRASYDLALKNVCYKYPDLAADLSGRKKTSTCCRHIKEFKKKRKAAQMGW